MTKCYNTGNITGSSNYVGGIMVTSSNGVVYDLYNTGNVKGFNNVGGISGSTPNKFNYYYLYNTGNVSGRDYVGGIIGSAAVSAYGCTGSIYNCYNSGDVSAISEYVGGITGYLSRS